MPKQTLSPADALVLRQTLHLTALDALMNARRWASGELVFQGGTSLHLMHGSPRYSEDLDFLVDNTLELKHLARNMMASASLSAVAAAFPGLGLALHISTPKPGQNPLRFDITLSGANLLGSTRVKVELWGTPQAAIRAVRFEVKAARISVGPLAGAQAFAPTAHPGEILADKVFALVARDYLKPRDVFDLHWLTTVEGLDMQGVSAEQMRNRLLTYPSMTPAAWLQKAAARDMELQHAAARVQTDLQRWFPQAWSLGNALIDDMLACARLALARGAAVMRLLADDPQREPPRP